MNDFFELRYSKGDPTQNGIKTAKINLQDLMIDVVTDCRVNLDTFEIFDVLTFFKESMEYYISDAIPKGYIDPQRLNIVNVDDLESAFEEYVKENI